MNALVMNTLNGAVTEYTNFDFHSITPTHAGSATGLFAFGGDTDLGLPIVSEIRTATRLREDTLKKSLDLVYLSMAGSGVAEASVHGRTGAWAYTFPVRATGESRCPVGRGIRENYLGFGFRNLAGEAFQIDRIEILMRASNNRRV